MSQPAAVNPINPAVIALCLGMVAVEIILSAGEAGFVGDARAIGWRLGALQDYAFSPAVLDWMLSRGDYGVEVLRRFVTYPFIQSNFTGALFGIAMLLALGKFVGDVFSPLAVMVLFVVTTICGALVFGLVFEGATPLYGAFTPVYGLIGAYTYVTWLHLGHTGQNQLGAFRLIAFLLGLQLLFGALFGSSDMWVAELAGFIAGFAVSPLLAPGGWQALLLKMRRRR